RAFEHVDDPVAAAVGLHRGDVEAQAGRSFAAGGQPLHGEAPDPRLLRRCHCFGREPERVTAAGLYLPAHHRLARTGREIELALPYAPVAREHRETGIGVPTRDRVLARGSDLAARGGQRSLPGSSSMFTSLKVTTCTSVTKRVGRYMSQTHASRSVSSK